MVLFVQRESFHWNLINNYVQSALDTKYASLGTTSDSAISTSKSHKGAKSQGTGATFDLKSCLATRRIRLI